jgi:hypothetical protein
MALRRQAGTIRFEDEADPPPGVAPEPPHIKFLNPKTTLLNPHPEWCAFMQVRFGSRSFIALY